MWGGRDRVGPQHACICTQQLPVVVAQHLPHISQCNAVHTRHQSSTTRRVFPSPHHHTWLLQHLSDRTKPACQTKPPDQHGMQGSQQQQDTLTLWLHINWHSTLLTHTPCRCEHFHLYMDHTPFCPVLRVTERLIVKVYTHSVCSLGRECLLQRH